MQISPPVRRIFEFGTFTLDEQDRLLSAHGTIVHLTPKAADTLLLLVNRAGHVVDREELMKALWPDTFVEESSLTRNISQLRRALQEDESHPYIETIPKRGYRFTAEVKQRTVNSERAVEESRSRIPELAGRPGVVRRWNRPMLYGILFVALALTTLIVARPHFPFIEKEAQFQETPFTAFRGGEYEPVFSPDGNSLAFVWNGVDEKHYGVYVEPVAGGTVQQLVSDAAEEGSPAWSPDGKRIAFVRYRAGENGGLYIIDVQSRSEHKLASLFAEDHIFARKLDWSPDGSAVAVSDKRSAEDSFRIDLIQVSTGSRRICTTPPANSAGDTSPVFSPDGRRLALIRTTGSGMSDIYVVDLGSQEPRRLAVQKGRISALDWTADGKEIVFASQQTAGKTLWRVPLAGTPKPIVGIGSGAQFFSISRKGHKLAYSSWFADTNIWRLELSQSHSQSVPERLIASTRAETSAQYSPDGSKIAYRSDQSGATEIWVSDADGSHSRWVTDFNGPLTGSPRWSPDSKQIVFDSRPEGNSDIYIVQSSGGQPKRITRGPPDNVVPSWSQDGRSVYFASNNSGSWEVWKTAADQMGSAIQVTHSGGFAAFESSDGRTVYYAKSPNSAGLWQIPVAGGKEELLVPDLKVGFWGCWGVAKSGIFFVNPTPDGKAEIRLFRPDHRTTTLAAVLPTAPPFGDSGFSVSSDGSRLLFTQTDHSGSDIILARDFR
jgi:Tol biopolymer transport system component/DNA-binding winged helix-turn-helix (wHTH) protein